jgi:phospholipid/cholesterol/gamma-HCH transport system ATP-binding protein
MKPVISVRNFKKSFGAKEVHKNVNFDVLDRECLALIGGSGQGKSVILRSLIGLEKPDGGEILIQGESINDYDESQFVDIRRKVAYCFQNGALFDSMTVFDNLAYPLREHTTLSEKVIKDKVMDLLEDFGLAGNELVLPSDLSGGMQKRVGLARSIILGPKVVLYDEPTAGLDPFNTILIQELIIKLKNRGVTSVLVTHDMPSAFAVCDRIILLAGGVIAATGTTEELKKLKDGPLQKFISGKRGF